MKFSTSPHGIILNVLENSYKIHGNFVLFHNSFHWQKNVDTYNDNIELTVESFP